MGVGRVICVAFPFILTVVSLVAVLIVGLTGVANESLYLYDIDITNLTIPAAQLEALINNATDLLDGKDVDKIQGEIQNLTNSADNTVSNDINNIGSRSPSPVQWHDAGLLEDTSKETSSSNEKATSDSGSAISGNITAKELGLGNVYTYSLWGMCTTGQDGNKTCTKAEFDWASKELNLTWVETFLKDLGQNDTIPKALTDGLNVYKTVNKWTEVVFIIAVIALALMFAVGLFSACSRAISCIVYIFSGFAFLAVTATAALLTATAVIIVGDVKVFGSHYGAKAAINWKFLAVAWIAVAAVLVASLFWLFSVCCCAPEHRRSKRHHGSDGEKLLPGGAGGYAPLSDPQHNGAGLGYGAPQRGGARSDLAYEPYSHSRV
ncbi:hypothetical protein F5Y16DRAFT_139115 [Xylariaceae sp. FL0255]|nr:hypothetical protein F5Y16DRAFT_139115 [Xylariaceae sp. FL0255]